MGIFGRHGIGNSTAGYAVGGAGQQFPPRIVGQDHSAVEDHRVVRILTPQFLFLVLAYHTKGVRFGKFFIRLGMFHKAAAAGAEAQAVQRDGVIAQQGISDAEIQHCRRNAARPGAHLLTVQLHCVAKPRFARSSVGIEQAQHNGVALRLLRQLIVQPQPEGIVTLSVEIALHRVNFLAAVDLCRHPRRIAAKLFPFRVDAVGIQEFRHHILTAYGKETIQRGGVHGHCVQRVVDAVQRLRLADFGIVAFRIGLLPAVLAARGVQYILHLRLRFGIDEKPDFSFGQLLDIRCCGNACRKHTGGSHGSGHAHGYTAVLFQLGRRIAACFLYFFHCQFIDALFFLLAQRHGFCGILFQQRISGFCIATHKLQPPLNRYCAVRQTVCAVFRARGKV